MQCCSWDCLVKPAVYSQTMSIMTGPADPLKGRFKALLPFGRRQTQSLINTRGVRPNILLDSQSRQAWISFALCMCVFVCVYACWEKVRSLQKTKKMKVHTERSLAVHFALAGIIYSLHMSQCETRFLCYSVCLWWKQLCSVQEAAGFTVVTPFSSSLIPLPMQLRMQFSPTQPRRPCLQKAGL